MATKDFKTGDKVSWNSTQGKVTGTVKKKLTAPMDIKTHHVAASPDTPQLLVESDSSGKVAAHKPTALKKRRSAAPGEQRQNEFKRKPGSCNGIQECGQHVAEHLAAWLKTAQSRKRLASNRARAANR